ncbi:hypothetical protein ABEF94_000492 [Exophiala dermatitidis]
MATKKKVFVGSVPTSLWKDSSASLTTDAHDDPDDAPFVTYDAANKIFTSETEDRDALPNLLTTVSGYIENQENIQLGIDDEPRLRPMPGCVLSDPMADNSSDDNELLDYHSDEESDDNEDPLQSLQHLTAYWKPRSGDLSILLPAYAQEIRRLTGTEIFVEVAEKRYRLFQGNFKLAREKLLRLEPLLESFQLQRTGLAPVSAGNVLVWPTQYKDARLQFVKITGSHPAYTRVIVNKSETTLFRNVIGEIRLINSAFEYEAPGHLYRKGVSPTSQIQASSIWEGYVFKSFGDPSVMNPVISSNPSSENSSSDKGTVKDPNEGRIAEWSTEVVPGADPDIAPEVPAIEPAWHGRRRIIYDTDTDSDEGGRSPALANAQLDGQQDDIPVPGMPPRATTPKPTSDLLSLVSSPPRGTSTNDLESMIRNEPAQAHGLLTSLMAGDEDFLTGDAPPWAEAMARVKAQHAQAIKAASTKSAEPVLQEKLVDFSSPKKVSELVSCTEALAKAEPQHIEVTKAHSIKAATPIPQEKLVDISSPLKVSEPVSSTKALANPEADGSEVIKAASTRPETPKPREKLVDISTPVKVFEPASSAKDIRATGSLAADMADLQLDEPSKPAAPKSTLSNPTSVKSASSAEDIQATGLPAADMADLQLDEPSKPAAPKSTLSNPTSAKPAPPLLDQTTPPRPATADASSPRPAFDPKSYGTPSKKLRRGQNLHAGRHPGNTPRATMQSRGGRGYVNNNVYAQAAARGQFSASNPPREPRAMRGYPFRGSPSRPGVGASRGGRASGSPRVRPADLVDTSLPANPPAPNNGTPRIPPGFEAHVPLVRAETPPPRSRIQTPNIMDEPIEAGPSGQKPPASAASTHRNIRFSDEGSDYVTTKVPKRDVAFLRENALRSAIAAVEAQKEAKAQVQGKSPVPSSGFENKKAEDNDPAPPYHSTMRQQGKNPGKKQPVKNETKAEAAARRAQALLDAHGPVPAKAKAPSSPKSQASKKNSSSTESMSNWKKNQIRKNAPVADDHSKIVEDLSRKQTCDKLVSQLEPLFETCRAFNGRVMFEMAIGQVLVWPGVSLSEQNLYKGSDWEKLFDPTQSKTPCATTFTKIITTNGADIDRALEVKGPMSGAAANDDNASKLWYARPHKQSVTYEFLCQTRTNEDFVILVDESGNHEIRKGYVTIGQVNLHVPASVWDASAMLSGDLKWFSAPEPLEKSAETFAKSLYIVPNRKNLQIVFRQPSDHEVQVRNVIVKRVSYHACRCADKIQLKVVESKSLMFKVHPQDKRLWHGYEATTAENYAKLARDSRIHYEMSVVHTGINDILAENEHLEIGDLTPVETTGKSLLVNNGPAIRSMLDVAMCLVSKIDWLGSHNFGTQPRLDMQKEEQARQIEASLAAQGKSVFPHAEQQPTRVGVASATVSKQQQPQIMMKPAGAVTAATGNLGGLAVLAGVDDKAERAGTPPRAGAAAAAAAGSTPNTAGLLIKPPVPGVRMDTVAEIYQDPEDGYRYMVGMGGARIPVVPRGSGTRSGGSATGTPTGTPTPGPDIDAITRENDNKLSSAASIMPDESASQVGLPAKHQPQQQQPQAQQGQQGQQSASASASPLRAPWSTDSNRGVGFW